MKDCLKLFVSTSIPYNFKISQIPILGLRCNIMWMVILSCWGGNGIKKGLRNNLRWTLFLFSTWCVFHTTSTTSEWRQEGRWSNRSRGRRWLRSSRIRPISNCTPRQLCPLDPEIRLFYCCIERTDETDIWHKFQNMHHLIFQGTLCPDFRGHL